MKQPTLREVVHQMHGCEPATKWSRGYGTRWAEAWKKCQRGEWLVWLLSSLGADHRRLVAVVLERFREELPRVVVEANRDTIRSIERWSRGGRAAAPGSPQLQFGPSAFAWRSFVRLAEACRRDGSYSLNHAVDCMLQSVHSSRGLGGQRAASRRLANALREQFSYSEVRSLYRERFETKPLRKKTRRVA